MMALRSGSVAVGVRSEPRGSLYVSVHRSGGEGLAILQQQRRPLAERAGAGGRVAGGPRCLQRSHVEIIARAQRAVLVQSGQRAAPLAQQRAGPQDLIAKQRRAELRAEIVLVSRELRHIRGVRPSSSREPVAQVVQIDAIDENIGVALFGCDCCGRRGGRGLRELEVGAHRLGAGLNRYLS